MQWYYTVQGQRQGPVDDAGLEDLVRRGVIRDDTDVWRDGLAEWQLYGAVKPIPAAEEVAAPAGLMERHIDRPIENPAAGGSGVPTITEPYAAQSYSAPTYAAPFGSTPAYSAPAAVAQPATAEAKGYLFYYPVLRALGDGRVIRTCVVWGLKIGAFAVALGGLLS